MSDFWTRRRRAVADADAAEQAAALSEAEARDDEARAADLADLSDEEVLERLSLPDPDAVRSGDEVRAFMARAVPAHLRRRALRSLWRSNPVLANLDGLNDYDGDFTGDGLRGAALRTSYEVGRGLAAHVRRQLEDEPDEKNQAIAPQPPAEKTLAETPPDVEPFAREAREEGPAPDPVTPPRAMRFTFEEDDGE